MHDLKLYGNSEREAERLTNTVRIFSKDIDLEFRLCKCAHVTIKAGTCSYWQNGTLVWKRHERL